MANDATGRYFLKDMAAFGVDTNPAAVAATGKSGRCLVLVTKDAERTMNTFLGISSALGIDEIDTSALADSRIFYVEGYVCSSADGLAAASIVPALGRKSAG